MSGIKRGLQKAVAGCLRVPGIRGATKLAARTGLLPQSVWRRLPITGSIPLRLPGGSEIHYRSGLMDFLGRGLFFGGLGWWEPEILRVLPGLARRARGVVDVGAHTGLFTLVALAENATAQAIAIEPVMANAQLLHANLRENGLIARCVVAVAAAAVTPGLVDFDPGPVEVPMTASIRVDPGDGGGVRVPAVSLDAIAGWVPSVDLIKIDVEGFEHLVLEGGRETLTHHRPTLVVECLPGSRIEDFADLWDRLGYRRFHLLADRAEPIPVVRPTADAPTHNYLFAARPDMLAEWTRPDSEPAPEER